MRSHSTASAVTAEQLLDAVVRSFDGCPDARLRLLMRTLVTHLHQFVVETALTEQEWERAVGLLTETGHLSGPERQEFVLWSDTLGLSSLIDLLAHGGDAAHTESTVRGPFWVAGSPWRDFGAPIAQRPAGEPAWVHGQVVGPDGAPVAGAVVDVWQNGADSRYGVQDPSAPPGHLRGRFRTTDAGRYAFLGVRPTPYRIPDDGPVGTMLRATGRGAWRPGHLHLMITAERCAPLTTHIFDTDSAYLDEDAVFAVKPSLLRTFTKHDADEPETPPGVNGIWYDVVFDVQLQQGQDAGDVV
jgi:catechol 1,2-dioxygenase